MNHNLSLAKRLQSKSDIVVKSIIKLTSEEGIGLEVINGKVSLSYYPAEVKEDGSFFIVTGTKENPAGFGLNKQDLILLYRKEANYGCFIDSSVIITIIKEQKSILKIGIDNEYKSMGVWMNLGIITNYLDEDFLSALSPSS